MNRTLFIGVALFIIIHLLAQKATIGYVFPAGAERGTTTEISIGGQNVSSATAVVISGKGLKAEIIPTSATDKNTRFKGRKKLDDQSSPQLADQIRIRVTIDKNAFPGLRDLRLESKIGVSNKLNFEIGQYPNLKESTLSTLQNPEKVKQLPAVLCGQILPGQRDYYRFRATKGAHLVVAVKARLMVPFIADAVPGWFQPVITLYNNSGKEVAYCDDNGLKVDPVIVFKVPETDDYTLMIRDAIYRGREDFTYRIDVGEIPYLKMISPAVAKQGTKLNLQLSGVNLANETMKFNPKVEGFHEVSAKGKNNSVSNNLPLFALPKGMKLYLPTDKLNFIEPGKAVFDSISSEVKKYRINAQKGDNLSFEIMANRIGSGLDGRLRLTDATGKVLAESDDDEDNSQGLITFHADPKLSYKFATNGECFLEVEDVLHNTGKECFYLLQCNQTGVNFELYVSPAIVSVAKGGTALITVTVNSTEKLQHPIDLQINGLPAGAKLSNTLIPAGVKKKDITVTLPDYTSTGEYDLKVSGTLRNRKDQTTISVQKAVAADDMLQAFYYHHNIPASGFSLKVTPEAPYKLSFSSELLQNDGYMLPFSKTDTLLTIPVEIKRVKGFTESIELSVFPMNKQVSFRNNIVGANETTKDLIVKINGSSKGKFPNFRMGIVVVGTVKGEIDKRGKRTFENAAFREISPLIIVIPKQNRLR